MQLRKALYPICLQLLGIYILVNAIQVLNALLEIYFNFLDRSILIKFKQLKKALFPILSTYSGILILTILFFINAFDAIFFIGSLLIVNGSLTLLLFILQFKSFKPAWYIEYSYSFVECTNFSDSSSGYNAYKSVPHKLSIDNSKCIEWLAFQRIKSPTFTIEAIAFSNSFLFVV